MAMYTYNVTIDGTLYDLTSIVDSSTLKIVKPLCSTEKKSGKGTMDVTLKGGADPVHYKAFIQALLGAQEDQTVGDCEIVVLDDSNNVQFRGFLDNSEIDIASRIFPEALTLAAMDKSTLLDRKIKLNRHWKNQTRNQIIRDLFSALAADSGLSITLLSTDLSDTKVISHFAVTEDEEKTYRDVVDTILFEAVGYVLWYDPEYDGYRVKLIPTVVNPNGTYRQVKYLLSNNLQTKSVIYDNDGVLLAYPTIVERDNTNLYFENINISEAEDGTRRGEILHSGDHFPVDGDVKEIYQEYRIADRPYITGESRLENEDLKLLYATGVSYQLTSVPMVNLAPALPNVNWDGTAEFYPRKARVLFRNQNAGDANITLLSFTGTAVYVDYMNRLTVPDQCVNPEEKEVTTIDNETEAKAFAQWYYNSQRFGGTISQWSEPEGYSTLGEIVMVVHKESGVQMPHVIVQMNNENAGGQSGTIRKVNVTAISLYGWASYASSVVSVNSKGSNTTEQRVTRWYNGTAVTGKPTARGWSGNAGDYYLNTDTYDLYRCTTSGNANTAVWTYIGNIKGADADIEGATYTLEYGLSTSASEFIFEDADYGYENTETDDLGIIDDDVDSDTYGDEVELGFQDFVWSDSPTDGWYKGLYVWQRLKTSVLVGYDEDNEPIYDVTYGDPTYCEEITQSLIDGCVLQIVMFDADGDGDTHTWQRNGRSVADVPVTFTVQSRSYENLQSFKDALALGGVSVRTFLNSQEVSSMTLPVPVEDFEDETRTAKLTYTLLIPQAWVCDSLVITASIVDEYMYSDGNTYTVTTRASDSLNCNDVTGGWQNLGTFASDPIDADGVINDGLYEGKKAILGDIYLKRIETTVGDQTTLEMIPMMYTDAENHVFERLLTYEGSEQYDEKLLSLLPNVFSTADSNVSLITSGDYTWVTNLVARKVTAEMISALQISLLDNGFIKSNNYETVDGSYPTSGFFLGTDGIAHFYDAYLSDIHVKCLDSLHKVLLQTQEYQAGMAAFTPYDTNAASRWCIDDLNPDSTYPLLRSDGTFDGTSYSFLGSVLGDYGYRHLILHERCTVLNGRPNIIDRDVYRFNFTVPQSGYYGLYMDARILCTCRDLTTGAYLIRQTADNERYAEVYLQAGHTIEVLAYQYQLYFYQDSTKYTSVCTKNSYTSTIGTSEVEHIDYTRVYAIPKGAVLANRVIMGSFDSNDHLDYKLLAPSFDNISVGEIQCENNSNVTIDGMTYSPLVSIGKSPNWISFNTSGSYVRVSYPRDTSQFAMTGWFRCTGGSIDVVGQESAIVTYHIMPFEDGQCRLGGSGKAWSEVTAYTFNTLSAERYKENIRPYRDNATDKINDIDIVSYQYKGKDERRVGFIADRTDELFTTKGHDKFDMTNTIGMLLKAIQELSHRIDRLERDHGVSV